MAAEDTNPSRRRNGSLHSFNLQQTTGVFWPRRSANRDEGDSGLVGGRFQLFTRAWFIACFSAS